jgi:hypothetical protein
MYAKSTPPGCRVKTVPGFQEKDLRTWHFVGVRGSDYPRCRSTVWLVVSMVLCFKESAGGEQSLEPYDNVGPVAEPGRKTGGFMWR